MAFYIEQTIEASNVSRYLQKIIGMTDEDVFTSYLSDAHPFDTREKATAWMYGMWPNFGNGKIYRIVEL